MRKKITIAVILALTLTCLTSCGWGSPISRSSVGKEWDALLGGELKVVSARVLVSTMMSSPYDSYITDSETIDEVIAVLKEIDAQIEKEKDEPSPDFSGRYDFYIANITLFINTGAEGAIVETYEAEDVEYNYAIHINLRHDDECNVVVSDRDPLMIVTDEQDVRKSSIAHFKCKNGVAEYCEALKAIFEN